MPVLFFQVTLDFMRVYVVFAMWVQVRAFRKAYEGELVALTTSWKCTAGRVADISHMGPWAEPGVGARTSCLRHQWYLGLIVAFDIARCQDECLYPTVEPWFDFSLSIAV